MCECTDFGRSPYFKLAFLTIWGEPIAVVSVVVVDIAVFVDVTGVVGVTRVRRPQPPPIGRVK